MDQQGNPHNDVTIVYRSIYKLSSSVDSLAWMVVRGGADGISTITRRANRCEAFFLCSRSRVRLNNHATYSFPQFLYIQSATKQYKTWICRPYTRYSKATRWQSLGALAIVSPTHSCIRSIIVFLVLILPMTETYHIQYVFQSAYGLMRTLCKWQLWIDNDYTTVKLHEGTHTQ